MTLRAVVIGAGYAAEGHTTALREAGVNVVALCGRTPEPAQAMADKLGITDIRFDWRQAIAELQPDIVAITTPGAPHREMAEYVAEKGCHVACEKPLALSAADAQSMLLAAEQAQVKHAYAATGCYEPQMMHAQKLLSEGLIGQVREIEYVIHMNFSPYKPYHWFHRLDQGGGWLYQGFTHQLMQISRITGAQVRSATGEARRLIERAPVGSTLHDWREFMRAEMDPKQAEAGEWREVDADSSFTALTQLQLPDGQSVSALFQFSSRAVSNLPNHLTFYGTEGTLQLTGSFVQEQMQHYSHESQVWQDVPIPEQPIKGWGLLYREFVADIRGEGYAGYPTFRDGWAANEVIDIVRNGQGWHRLPEYPVG